MNPVTIPIREVMTPDPCAIDEALSVADARTRMNANDIRHLIVLHDQALAGVVDVHDLDLALSVTNGDAGHVPVTAAMRSVCLADRDEAVATVAHRMQRDRHTCAVVVENQTAVGIFTLSDALSVLSGRPGSHGPRAGATETGHAHPSEPDAHSGEAHTPVRVRRLLRSHHADHAAPTANDGMVFGKVFTEH